MTNNLLLLYTFLLSATIATAQQESLSSNDTINTISNDTIIEKQSVWKRLSYDFTAMGGGFIATITQPAKWENDDFLRFGATIVGTGVFYLSDRETSTFFRNQKEDVPAVIQNFGWYFGSPQNNYGITGSIYVYGLLANDEWARRTGVLMITSASVGGLLQQVSKSIAGRARPDAELGSNHFRPFAGAAAYRSFPSGHTVLSVTTTYALAKQFSSPWIKGGLYTVGMIAPLSRLWSGAHWLSDIFLSTVMSVAIVECVDSYLKREKKYTVDDPDRKNKISWSFKVGYSQLGLVGTF